MFRCCKPGFHWWACRASLSFELLPKAAGRAGGGRSFRPLSLCWFLAPHSQPIVPSATLGQGNKNNSANRLLLASDSTPVSSSVTVAGFCSSSSPLHCCCILQTITARACLSQQPICSVRRACTRRLPFDLLSSLFRAGPCPFASPSHLTTRTCPFGDFPQRRITHSGVCREDFVRRYFDSLSTGCTQRALKYRCTDWPSASISVSHRLLDSQSLNLVSANLPVLLPASSQRQVI
ncbi:hypothetical protein N657DRAFT_13252 [Parathielavia appendiculata]|uniref:Secreted protein n=1 Tax=Parathielavia appendiculata TaxID=2587402 RepID=A0AAN6Z8A2_9PEZI|nr:hypothetical protein N657DRAFT_13252 [Parathielavia appendiculata]